jgi:hypothetical protein
VQLGLGAKWREWRSGVAVLQEEVSREEEPELRRGWGVEGDMGGEVEGLSTGGEVIWRGRRLHGSEEDDRVVFRAAQPRRDSLQWRTGKKSWVRR